MDCHESLTLSLRVSEANAAIQSKNIDCHEFATANSRNDNKADCHDLLRKFRNDDKVDCHEFDKSNSRND